MGEAQIIDISTYPDEAKSLIVDLESPDDQNRANAWLKRLTEDNSTPDQLKTNYLKLLIYFLQLRKLDGPFLNDPDQIETLAEFPENVNIHETHSVKKKRRFAPDFFGKMKANTLRPIRANRVAQELEKKRSTLDRNSKLLENATPTEELKSDSRIKQFFHKSQQKIRNGFKKITSRSDPNPN